MKVSTRSEYFKTALNTDVGNGIKDKVIEVQECSILVLATVVDFMYGISIPEELSNDDAKGLLTMADLYLMEDLKDAVAPHLAKQLSKDNILETTNMAEKYSAEKLMDICTDFLHANIGDLDKTNVLDELFLSMPLVAKSCFHKQQRNVDIVSKVLGVTLTNTFKKRSDFKSRFEYKDYMMKNMKPDMLVVCNKASPWKRINMRDKVNVKEGTVGLVISHDINGAVVRWWSSSDGLFYPAVGSFLHLDLFTSPINTNWLCKHD